MIPVFILGNGPTLPDDLSALKDRLTIGVNRIFQVFSPTVLLWVDGSVYKDHAEQIDKLDSLLVCDRSVAQKQHHGLLTRVGDNAFTHKRSPTELCVNGNTGCCAARWALALGFSPVFLLGMDAIYIDGKTDFYGVNRHHHRTPDDNGTLHVMRQELDRLLRDCEDVWPLNSSDLAEAVAQTEPVDQNAVRAEILSRIT